MRRFHLSFVVGALLAAMLAPGASAEVPPPTLTGETFLGGLFAPPGTASTLTVTAASCDPNGTSTFTYQATGPAAGPYTGTYSETGTVTMGPQLAPGTPPTGTITSWSASFIITGSPTGTVSGTKTLPPNAPPVTGICNPGSPEFITQHSAATGSSNALAYTATITAAGGAQYSDQGFSSASVNEFPGVPTFNNFFENFISSQPTTTPICNQNDQTNQNQILNNQGCKNP